MSEWKVILAPEFKQEFKDIYSYIAEVLLVPETAKNQVTRILDQVEKLDEMPNRFPLFEKEPWHSRGLRKLIIDNYIVFYYPNEQMQEVVVFHIFYGGRNIDELLDKEKNKRIK
mgnify:FL=1